MVWTPESSGDFLQSTERSFERSAIGILHKQWFPGLKLKDVESKYGRMDLWSKYSQYVSFVDQEPPELTFMRESSSWSLNLHKLLYKNVEGLPFYMNWLEQPSDGFVFPLIGKFGIVHYVSAPPDRDCLLRRTRKGILVCVELLESYAQTFNVEGFQNLEGEIDGEQ